MEFAVAANEIHHSGLGQVSSGFLRPSPAWDLHAGSGVAWTASGATHPVTGGGAK